MKRKSRGKARVSIVFFTTCFILGVGATITRIGMGYSIMSSNNPNHVTVVVSPEGYEYHILKLEVKQSHFSINLFDHMKDNMNALTFEIPVDPVYYESVRVGDVLADEFRKGSFVTSGSLGNWEITVKDKYIK